mmetsp:Transcript_12358/g.42068  ORF Transcript_12358/g.42068 Transcript_12358/m.42068 type:complete len:96 (-) Transcript_12358:99-386(-)
MERDLTKPVFYVVPFAWLDNLMPARKGEEAMQAIVKEHQARIDDNSYPVFYVVPKPLITSVFPKYKDANSQSSLFSDCLSFVGSIFLVWAAILVE